MAHPLLAALTRRERHIMDVLFRRGRATAEEVMRELSGNPSYSTVRTQLRVLEEKGHVRHEEHGRRYVYTPAVRRSTARRSALRHVVDTFFDGSVEKVVAALLGGEGARVSPQELNRIVDLVTRAGKGGAKAPAAVPSGSLEPRGGGAPRSEKSASEAQRAGRRGGGAPRMGSEEPREH